MASNQPTPSPISPSSVSKAWAVIRSLSWFFRSTTFDFHHELPSISIIDRSATIQYRATLSKGMKIWFRRGGTIEIPVPDGLSLSTEIHTRARLLNAEYSESAQVGISINGMEALQPYKGNLRDGDIVEFQVKIPCNTPQLLTFDYPEGKTEVAEDGSATTTFAIRKKPRYADVVIEKFMWVKGLQGLFPFTQLKIVKNREEVGNWMVDATHTFAITAPANDLALSTPVILRDAQSVSGRSYRWSEQREIRIQLSFEKPGDEYNIIFHTPAR